MKDGSAFLNDNAVRIAQSMVDDAERLRVSVSTGPLGERLIDAGASALGSIEAGLRIAEMTMGGLGTLSTVMNRAAGKWPLNVEVRSSQPVIACLASQYAGWNLSSGNYFAMGSGPVRVLARVEPLFSTLSYHEKAAQTVIVLETGKSPPAPVVEKVAAATGLAPESLTFVYAPTQSIAGSVQIVSRVLEVAMHKANDLKFPLHHIVDGVGTAPIPAPHPDFLTAMGRTNDAIIYGGLVQLFVRGSASDARDLAEKMPSSASRDHGRPFAEVFRHFRGDFYAIDPLLFSPAEVIVTALDTGDTFRTGSRDLTMLEKSLG